MLLQDLADALAQAHVKGRYNELMVIAETCQAATLLERITAPNVVTMASSQKGEPRPHWVASCMAISCSLLAMGACCSHIPPAFA